VSAIALNTTLLNIVGVYAGWFACVLGAARGAPWVGPIVVLLLLTVHCRLLPDVAQELRLLCIVGLLGFILDTLLAALGVFSFPGNSEVGWISPPWMVALWVNFATSLRTSVRWLVGNPLLAASLGGMVGPLSYYAGAQFGVLTLHLSVVVTLGILAFVWAVVMPFLLRLAR